MDLPSNLHEPFSFFLYNDMSRITDPKQMPTGLPHVCNIVCTDPSSKTINTMTYTPVCPRLVGSKTDRSGKILCDAHNGHNRDNGITDAGNTASQYTKPFNP